MRYIVCDVECTGLTRLSGDIYQPLSVSKSGSEVIQIGGLILDERFNPTKGFRHYCDCMVAHSDARAYAVHQIDLREVRRLVGGIFLEEVLCCWIPEFYDENVTFIGYNTMFDMQMVRQSTREFPVEFIMPKRVLSKFPQQGRHFVDVMDFVPGTRRKLVSFRGYLEPLFQEFQQKYASRLRIESNYSSQLTDNFSAHDALYDSIMTYLLFHDLVLGKRIPSGVKRSVT